MDTESWIQISGLLVAAIALCWTAYGVYLNRKIKQAEFWLQLRDDFANYEGMHSRLRPGGDWNSGGGPDSVEEWVSLEGYMGLFEYCELMLKQRLLDEQAFTDSYRYRIVNLVSNPTIRQVKLIDHADGWQGFLKLCDRLNVRVHDA